MSEIPKNRPIATHFPARTLQSVGFTVMALVGVRKTLDKSLAEKNAFLNAQQGDKTEGWQMEQLWMLLRKLNVTASLINVVEVVGEGG